MSQRLHFEREPPITMDEWIDAVDRIDGVRMASRKSGHAEVFVPRFTEWVEAFRWSKTGVVSFKVESQDGDDPVMRVALLLARELNAQVAGDASV